MMDKDCSVDGFSPNLLHYLWPLSFCGSSFHFFHPTYQMIAFHFLHKLSSDLLMNCIRMIVIRDTFRSNLGGSLQSGSAPSMLNVPLAPRVTRKPTWVVSKVRQPGFWRRGPGLHLVEPHFVWVDVMFGANARFPPPWDTFSDSEPVQQGFEPMFEVKAPPLWRVILHLRASSCSCCHSEHRLSTDHKSKSRHSSTQIRLRVIWG